MTLEAYLNGALLYRINNFIPAAEWDETGDGRLLDGEWISTRVVCNRFYKPFPSGDAVDGWWAEYLLDIDIATHARLDHVVWSSSGTEEGSGASTLYPEFTYSAPSTGYWIGPQAGLHVYDYKNWRPDEEYSYTVTDPGTGTQTQHSASVRSTVKLYFVKISHKILRDPLTNNLILRGTRNMVMRDA